jgi:hypothetical protein
MTPPPLPESLSFNLLFHVVHGAQKICLVIVDAPDLVLEHARLVPLLLGRGLVRRQLLKQGPGNKEVSELTF